MLPRVTQRRARHTSHTREGAAAWCGVSMREMHSRDTGLGVFFLVALQYEVKLELRFYMAGEQLSAQNTKPAQKWCENNHCCASSLIGSFIRCAVFSSCHWWICAVLNPSTSFPPPLCCRPHLCCTTAHHQLVSDYLRTGEPTPVLSSQKKWHEV